MNILVLNAGSSSLKYQLFDMDRGVAIVKGNIEQIGEGGAPFADHKEALLSILPELTKDGTPAFEAIGHRVVHGGEYFHESVVIDDKVIDVIRKCIDLAPLHNPANLISILACKELFPSILQVAVFDTAFHQTMEPAHYLYPISYEYYTRYKIRRYGFHGISHKYVYEKLIANYKLPIANPRVITCHVGNGVSMAAIKDGKVVETSMGMTPLEGLMMGTRSGNIDPAIVTYLMTHESKTAEDIDTLLNKQSGLLGISGISNDMRTIIAGFEQGNPACILAVEMYLNSLVKYIGSYVALLGGVDAIVLTAGVMEHRTIVRTMFLQRLSWLGITIDVAANQSSDSLEKIVSAEDSKVKVIVIPTNEELEIAKETFGLIRKTA